MTDEYKAVLARVSRAQSLWLETVLTFKLATRSRMEAEREFDVALKAAKEWKASP